MSNKFSKDKDKAKQDKIQMLLCELLREEDNKYCADCDGKGPRWASWSLGIFVCIRCAGIHRNLGVHLSRVKSVNLDSWTEEELSMMQQIGNARAKMAYEANLPNTFTKPNSDSGMESFIRAKYEHKKYLDKGWMAPKPHALNLAEEKRRVAKMAPPSQPSVAAMKPAASAPTGLDKQAAAAPAPKPAASAGSDFDLLGDLDVSPAAVPVTTAVKSAASADDLFGDFMTSQPSVPQQPQNNSSSMLSDLSSLSLSSSSTAPNGASQDLFGNPVQSTSAAAAPGTAAPQQSLKDSIMALYGRQPTQQPQYNQPSQLPPLQQQGGFAGGFPQQGLYNMQAAPNQYGQMQQQQQQQQQGGWGNMTPGGAGFPQQMPPQQFGGQQPGLHQQQQFPQQQQQGAPQSGYMAQPNAPQQYYQHQQAAQFQMQPFAANGQQQSSSMNQLWQ